MSVPKKRKLKLRRMRKGVIYHCYQCNSTIDNHLSGDKTKTIHRTCNTCLKKNYNNNPHRGTGQRLST